MRIVDVVLVLVLFLKFFEYFGLVNWSEVQFIEFIVEGLVEEDDVDVDLFEGFKNLSVFSF